MDSVAYDGFGGTRVDLYIALANSFQYASSVASSMAEGGIAMHRGNT
jgi:hypothetical protein